MKNKIVFFEISKESLDFYFINFCLKRKYGTRRYCHLFGIRFYFAKYYKYIEIEVTPFFQLQFNFFV